jgi:hypothetical protein
MKGVENNMMHTILNNRNSKRLNVNKKYLNLKSERFTVRKEVNFSKKCSKNYK